MDEVGLVVFCCQEWLDRVQYFRFQTSFHGKASGPVRIAIGGVTKCEFGALPEPRLGDACVTGKGGGSR